VTVLVVAAHPDDEVLGCGGTMARLAAEGHAVHVLILGEGETSRHAQRGDADAATVRTLGAQAQRAGEILGAESVTVKPLPDNRFDGVDLLDIVKVVEQAVTDVGPTLVFTHHAADLNIDHSLTCRAVVTATRPLPGSSVSDVYAFEVNSSTEWAFHETTAFRPNTFFDITTTLDKKLAAISAYEAELRDFPHPRSVEALTAAAQRWGSVSGYGAAEAFQLLRSCR